MSDASVYLVVTTINKPNEVMKTLAAGSVKHGWHFVVIGDSKSPPDFSLEDAEYLDLAAQQSKTYRLAKSCPIGRYTRKNIGYLVAMAAGANVIVETDDDNIPRDTFFEKFEGNCILHNPKPTFSLVGYYRTLAG
jgi:hypothetical protein